MIERALFEQYAFLEDEKRKIEQSQKDLKPLILEAIAEAGKPIEVNDIGIFSTGSRPKWKYSSYVVAAEKALYKSKKTEEANGKAKRIEGEPYPIFKPIKKDPQ